MKISSCGHDISYVKDFLGSWTCAPPSSPRPVNEKREYSLDAACQEITAVGDEEKEICNKFITTSDEAKNFEVPHQLLATINFKDGKASIIFKGVDGIEWEQVVHKRKSSGSAFWEKRKFQDFRRNYSICKGTRIYFMATKDTNVFLVKQTRIYFMATKDTNVFLVKQTSEDL